MRFYAIGDVHGQLDMLCRAHERIAADRKACGDPDAPVIHLGDFCDRGPDSAGVLQYLIDGIIARRPWWTVKGNHDRMFAGFLQDHSHKDAHLRADLTWLDSRLGGVETLASYGVHGAGSRPLDDLHREARQAVPQAHRDFLQSLPLFHDTDDLVFVHAGIRPGIALADQVEDDLIWIREGFLEDPRDHGKIIVHGHTAVETPTHFGNRIDLDSGAGYFRPLTAAVFEGRDCWILTDGGRSALWPQR